MGGHQLHCWTNSENNNNNEKQEEDGGNPKFAFTAQERICINCLPKFQVFQEDQEEFCRYMQALLGI